MKMPKKTTECWCTIKLLITRMAPMGMDARLNTMYSNTENPNKSEISHYSPGKHDFSEIYSGRINKMGEGKKGPSHYPLPKVVVRPEEKSLKSYGKPNIGENLRTSSRLALRNRVKSSKKY